MKKPLNPVVGTEYVRSDGIIMVLREDDGTCCPFFSELGADETDTACELWSELQPYGVAQWVVLDAGVEQLFELGDVVVLEYDDGTSVPQYRRVSDGRTKYYRTTRLSKLVARFVAPDEPRTGKDKVNASNPQIGHIWSDGESLYQINAIAIGGAIEWAKLSPTGSPHICSSYVRWADVDFTHQVTTF